MRRTRELGRRIAAALSSLKLTLACLGLLMALVAACTVAQVSLGTHDAVERFMRSFLVWWRPAGGPRLPVFPGGGLVGLVLLANLVAAQFLRLEWSRRKAGLWLAHLGVALLFLGEFSAALLQVDSRMPLEVGQTRAWAEDYRQMELAVSEDAGPGFSDVRAIPESLLKSKAEIAHPSLPFKLVVRGYHDNAELGMRRPGDPPSPATAGVGANVAFRPLPPVTSDDQENTAVALVEPVAPDGTSFGTFLLSNALGAPQSFALDGRSFILSLRPRRYRLPFALTLKEFRHDVYPGTDIPKNFSSLVRLSDPASGDDRDVLVYMNAPLRHAGLTVYQASFGKDDRLSVLQVVRNPGWTVPYLACALVAAGLVWHFLLSLGRSLGRPA